MNKLKTKTTNGSTWKTKGGTFTTNRTADCSFILPEFHQDKQIQWTCYVDEKSSKECRYDMIIGRDLLHELGFIMDFKTGSMTWENATISMHDTTLFDKEESKTNIKQFEKELFYAHDPSTTDAERIQRITEQKYSKTDLDIFCDELLNLESNQIQDLKNLLHKYEDLFDGGLGTWNTTPINLELKPGATPYHAKPYPVPFSQEAKLREEVDRLVKFGVLRKINNSEWAAPMFTSPKPDGSLRSLADFRELNKRIKRLPYPIPKIQDMLLKLRQFQWVTSLDLNMGYYHMTLSSDASKLCTIVLPWGKYEYLRLPMGLCNSPDIFQEKMGELMADLEFARAYLDDLLIVSNGSYEDHLEKVEQVLAKLQKAGLKVNIHKSKLLQEEVEYLGYHISRNGIKPINAKVEAINNIATPTTRKQLRKFIGMVNFYRDMWIHRSHVMAPLTQLTSTKAKWKWEQKHQDAFNMTKKIIARETKLAFPDFSKPFNIHTDASNFQLGAVISQEGNPIAFYSRKLTSAQTRYTVTEKELLSIVEVLKAFKNILFGQQIIVFTDHLNLTYKTHNSDRVMRWRLYIEEYCPEIKYIKGAKNTVADALSRLEIKYEPMEEAYFTHEVESHLYCLAQDELEDDAYPLTYKKIGKAQSKDKDLTKKITTNAPGYKIKEFKGGGKTYNIICYKDKIAVAKSQQARIIKWYHEYLCHPGINRTEETIGQHFHWPKMRAQITHNVTTCLNCQRNKRKKDKYGHLPPKEAEATPWDKLCVDLIGPYVINRKGKPRLTCQCLTMIDPATGWFEIHPREDKTAITAANIVEQQWLSRYPWPTQITFDRGREFLGQEFQNMTEDYGLVCKPITTQNPQANAILERIHQVIANIIRTFELQDNYLDEEDPWGGILAATAFAVRATYHTTLQKTPGQLVFGRDMILNIEHKANWEYIRARKQALINKNNLRENSKRKHHTYQKGELVMLRIGSENKYERPYEGPHRILRVNTNGTVKLQIGAVTDTITIRRLHPYKDASSPVHGGECNMRQAKRRRTT